VLRRYGLWIESIEQIFSRVCRDAGLSDLIPHDMRYTATTIRRRAAVDALTAMKITGHKAIAVFRRYHTVNGPDLPAAQACIDTYVSSATAAKITNGCTEWRQISVKPRQNFTAGVAEWVDAQDLKSKLQQPT
jgi:hypothetical protein